MANEKTPHERGENENKKAIFVMKIKENLLYMQICCNLAPEEMREREKEVFALLPHPGTVTASWSVSWDIQPVKCAHQEGYWHYICVL